MIFFLFYSSFVLKMKIPPTSEGHSQLVSLCPAPIFFNQRIHEGSRVREKLNHVSDNLIRHVGAPKFVRDGKYLFVIKYTF